MIKILNLSKNGDIVRISKYKNTFAKRYTIFPKWFEKVPVIEKFKNTVSWTYVISDPKGEETAGKFYENELQQINQIEFRFEEVIKRKGDRLHVKRKGYDSSLHSWIDKKDIVK